MLSDDGLQKFHLANENTIDWLEWLTINTFAKWNELQAVSNKTIVDSSFFPQCAIHNEYLLVFTAEQNLTGL